MKLKINRGELDVEIFDGIDDVRKMLRERGNIFFERRFTEKTQAQDINTLNPRQRMPI